MVAVTKESLIDEMLMNGYPVDIPTLMAMSPSVFIFEYELETGNKCYYDNEEDEYYITR